MKSIDISEIKNIYNNLATNLENNKHIVDSLNVFPVPDGDTGTNMNLTMQSALKEIMNSDEKDFYSMFKAAANGALMGARGNSGVILSQLLRGFSEGMKGIDTLDTINIAKSMDMASKTAYKAVMKPIEGTILTVARESAEKALEISEEKEDIVEFLELVLEQARDTLERTPDMLDVLKKSGVVDAGGKGFVLLIEGALLYLKGEKLTAEIPSEDVFLETDDEISGIDSVDDIVYAYCTEFIVLNTDVTRREFLRQIQNQGDSIVCIKNDNILKTHIHTNNPGKILEMASRHGELTNIKIENMKEQFREKNKKKKKEAKKYSFISIGMGDGIKELFKDLMVDEFISGGQTMNPSTQDILNSVDKVTGEHVFILPNNSNIILAANQAAELSERDIHVLPTKTIPQGVSAMLAFNEEVEPEINEESMLEAIKEVKTGQVTYAVRDTSVDTKNIKKDDIIGIHDGKIVSHGENMDEVVLELAKEMIDEDSYLITIFYGEDIAEEKAKEIKETLAEIAPECDVELINGGQPLYYYIISVE
jgi:hypothetical protein